MLTVDIYPITIAGQLLSKVEHLSSDLKKPQPVNPEKEDHLQK